MISVPYHTLKAYIIRAADIICAAYITRSDRNGYHCKRHLQLQVPIAWSEWRDLNPRPLDPQLKHA